MPAIGVGTPVFLVVQALVSAFVYSEASAYRSSSAILLGFAAFGLGVALVVVLGTVLEIVAIELGAILLSLLGRRASRLQPSP